MEDTQRWSVMYTKHVRQKRKVYQDGFLELPSFRNKVIDYNLLLSWVFAVIGANIVADMFAKFTSSC